MSFARNAEIYGEKEPADYLYKVVSGTVRTYKVLADNTNLLPLFNSHLNRLSREYTRITRTFPGREQTSHVEALVVLATRDAKRR